MSPPGAVVLVVDDDPDILESLKDALEISLPGASVHVARNGHEALSDLSGGPVDLMITDYRMPGMTGSELIERAHDVVPGLACVLMSAFPDAAIQAGPRARPHAFIRKPMNVTELIQTSQRLLAETGSWAA